MATTNEERLKILQMLEDGKITAEDAATLLRALEGKRAGTSIAATGGDNRVLHVHVSDLASGADKVNVTIPVGLVRVGLRMAGRFAPEGFEEVDAQALEEAITSGTIGKLVEVTDAEGNERVEVYVE